MAIVEKKAQQISALRQPRPISYAIGILIPKGIAPHILIADVYIPVRSPTRLGNSCLIMLGRSTLPIAMASPITLVPINSISNEGKERNKIPPVSKIRLRRSVFSNPKRCDILGANN
jgi:hypothetical protein